MRKIITGYDVTIRPHLEDVSTHSDDPTINELSALVEMGPRFVGDESEAIAAIKEYFKKMR